MDRETQVWRYVVNSCKEGELEPHDRGQWWGIFLIDNNGMFTAVTDAGNYAYCWGPFSHTACKDFRTFLLGVNCGYMLEKISKKDYYDGEKTLSWIREHILQNRRDGYITKNQARERWDFSHYDDLATEDDFKNWYNGDSGWLCDAWEYAHYDHEPHAYYFFNKVFKRLQVQIRADLLAEGIIKEAS